MKNSKGEFIILDELFMKIIKLENFPETESLKGRYMALNDIISIITNSLE